MTTSDPDRPSLRELVEARHRTNPYPLFHQLRRRSPFLTEDGGFVVLGRHADCAAALRDPSMSARPDNASAAGGDSLQPSFMVQDPPDHTRLRRLVARAFAPKNVLALREKVTDRINALLSSARDEGQIDLVAGLAQQLPIAVICEWLGVPDEDQPYLHGLTERASRALDPYVLDDPVDVADAIEAEFDTELYLRDLVARRRSRPGTDLVTELVALRDGGDVLTEGELLSTLSLLLVAGHETAANLIGNGMLALLNDPAEFARVRRDPARADQVVEEVLRHDPPVQLTTRRTTAPTSFDDVDVPAGTRVMILFAAANRDPAVHAEPDRFWVDRPKAPHLAFSAGPHYCLGAGLGRLEAALAFGIVARRLVNPRLVPDTVEYRPHVNLRGPKRLVVAFDEVRSFGA